MFMFKIYLSSLNALFFFFLIMGLTLASSSSSWFGMWTGLELNLLSFIPLIMSSNTRYSSEAALKYFLIQALGSSLIIFASSMLLFSSQLFSIILTMALLLKLGSAPFHFWFPQIMEGLLWPQAAILMTFQKIAPLFMLSYLIDMYNISHILMMSIILSAVVGAIGGINQLSLRKIMAFSSINHMAWMITASMMSDILMMLYFIFYFIITTSIVMIFHFMQTFHFNHIYNNNNTTPSMKFISFLSLLSLGGLPPFTGFFPKWILIQEMNNYKLYFILFVLLLSALVTLYYYLRLSLSSYNLSSLKLKSNILTEKKTLYTPIFISLNLFGLILPISFLVF
uniref:NADH dehydrogenase subunit 2 n=1 Tax=Allogalathea elegans TaxID=541025 RepID=UPI002181F61E|nr:NADH dehydrogenase subunit 2 [Allogalathea elegans]UVF62807.1 NADH dehydrogenase subunit 2 [Allogalathea elegans]